MTQLLALTIPLLMGSMVICGLFRGVEVFPAMTRGALDGLCTVRDMLPALIVLFPAVYMLRASGALEALGAALGPFLSAIGIPPETAALAILRPISGGAATAAGTDIIAHYGADTLIGRTAAVMLGSSETTFYVVAVYFAAAGVKKTRWAIPAALCADAAVYISSALVCRLLWG